MEQAAFWQEVKDLPPPSFALNTLVCYFLYENLSPSSAFSGVMLEGIFLRRLVFMFLTVFRVAWVMFCLNGKYVVAWGSMFCCYLQGTNSYLGYEKNLGKLVSY